MPRTLNFTAVASVTLNGSGNGTAAIGPKGTREVWQAANYAVSCSSNVNEATCKVYAGAQVNQGTFVDGTTWGSTGDSDSVSSNPLYPGLQVFAVWTGGDSGATATLVVTGTRTIP